MYLKSLELHGFKSFPERTLLKFNEGATIIVGPNGSGKSNITDAMRWVLGELSSKTIRGNKMEDVIFAGADDKKPMSFAEVSVTFDDSGETKVLQSDYKEITVTRRLYRSGDSEYYINRQKVRLKDIYELFMNTGIGREGYSIIGQGKIAEIISKKSDERRGVFEESAGIAKYRYKKNESEKKLIATESNMERVSDIERELASRIGPLEKESEKAKKFLDLYNDKKKTDISLWIYDADRLKKQIVKTEDEAQLSEHELEMAEDTAHVISGKIERLYEQSHNNTEASRRNFEETSGTTKLMNAAESESKVLSKDKSNSEKQLENEKKLYETTAEILNEEKARLVTLESQIAEITESSLKNRTTLDIVTSSIAEIEEKIADKNTLVDHLFEEKTESEQRLADLNVRLNVLVNSITTQKERSEAILGDIEKYQDEIALLEKTTNASLKTVKSYETEISGIDEKLKSITTEAQERKDEYDKLDQEERSKKAQLESLDSRINALSAMLEHFEGYNYSVKHVMNAAKSGAIHGIRGPVSYLIKVDEKYIVAIETALGSALQNIVTENEETAKACIEELKRSNAGRATFYPLTTMKPQERGNEYNGLEKTKGFIGWGDELVNADKEYRPVVQSLLARLAVYDTLDHASDAAKQKGWRIRAVTLDGQQINAGGSFTGGQTKRESGMLSRTSQINALKKESKQIESEIAELTQSKAEIAKKIEEITNRSHADEERKGLLAALMNAENQSFSDADGRRKTLVALVDSMRDDAANLASNSEHSEEDLARLNELIAAEKEAIGKIAATREEASIQKGEFEILFAEKNEELNQLKITLAELDRDYEAADTRKLEATERIRKAESDSKEHENLIALLKKQIVTLDENEKEKIREAEELRGKIDTLTDARKKLEANGDDIEKQISQLRQAEREQNAKKDIVFMAHSKNVSKLESLKNEEEKLATKIWDDYELTFALAEKFAEENDCHKIEDGERTKYIAVQTELKNKIKSLGHVNVEAINEYKEVKERYEYIKTQLDDLRASKDELQKIISGIDADMTRIFLEAFDKINRYFGEVFRELFGGGHAEVVLSDPSNVLESGIEINAAPPGKTIKNLNLLSGGEQAFIAIALMFALIKVNPSPFCIFDEIEAALDEVNVSRVGRYIKRYSKEMQIIMISHRRGTMDIADTLYGVTMPKSGVSKVFTLGSGDDREALLK